MNLSLAGSPHSAHKGEEDIISGLRELQRKVRGSGRPLIDLSMINPDIPPARLVLDKLVEASLIMGNHRYSVSRGTAKLREAFAYKYKNTFGVALDADSEVCVGAGTKETLVQAIHLLAKRTSKVLLPSPTYPAHRAAVELAGLEPVLFQLQTDEAAMLTSIEEQLVESGAGAILLNFPNNPTGMQVSQYFYEGLGNIAERCGCFIINDFVYGEMSFSGEACPSLLSVPGIRDFAAETYSLSKAYNIPGWRVGALLGNSDIIRELARYRSQADYGIFLPLQMASAAVLTARDNLVAPVVRSYHERAQLLCRLLEARGWEVFAPHAGASVWGRLPAETMTRFPDGSVAFAKSLLSRAGVVVTPGELFGAAAKPFVRFALVASLEQLREVAHRLDAVDEPEMAAVAFG